MLSRVVVRRGSFKGRGTHELSGAKQMDTDGGPNQELQPDTYRQIPLSGTDELHHQNNWEILLHYGLLFQKCTTIRQSVNLRDEL